MVGSAPLKLYYANMTGSRPARVRLFVNRTELAAENYLVFLRKKLREAFGMIGTPLVIELKARPKKVESVRRNENRENNRNKRRNG
jgi:GTP-binding protein